MKSESFEAYTFINGRHRMQFARIYALLKETYWAKDRTVEAQRASMRHVLCYGVLDERRVQVGYARVLTDFATTFYLADVVVSPSLRGKGIGKAFLRYILSDPRLQNQKGILLTRNAQGFYEHEGFVRWGERCMLREQDHR